MITTGLQRNTIDKYYTSPEIVTWCLGHIQECLKIDKERDLCIEPSAGSGAFLEAIRQLSDTHLFYDLEPPSQQDSLGCLIQQQDYLDDALDLQTLKDTYQARQLHLIGNPPFGRQSSLAIQFIKKSAKVCDSISFILPRSFKKPSLQKHFPLHFYLDFQEDVPHNDFLVNQKKYHVPCVFQIWRRQSYPRKVSPKCLPNGFTFVKQTEPHHISFRRVGVRAGHIDRNTLSKSTQSHYFLRFHTENVSDKLFQALQSITFSCSEHTAGPKSISKQELILEFNPIIQDIGFGF